MYKKNTGYRAARCRILCYMAYPAFTSSNQVFGHSSLDEPHDQKSTLSFGIPQAPRERWPFLSNFMKPEKDHKTPGNKFPTLYRIHEASRTHLVLPSPFLLGRRLLGYRPLPPARARLTVARPLARPTPRPLTLRLRNMGAFRSMSGTMKKRTWDPRMYTWSRWETRPSRAVTVMSLSWTFMLSS